MFLTTFVLCLASVMLMVLANDGGEGNDLCPHYQSVVIDRGSLSRSYRVAEANKCYGYDYDNASYYCATCDYTWHGLFTVFTQHHMVSNGVCAYCGYDSNND